MQTMLALAIKGGKNTGREGAEGRGGEGRGGEGRRGEEGRGGDISLTHAIF
jgi:hypothetical protein